MRVKRGGLVWSGIKCSSWIAACLHQTMPVLTYCMGCGPSMLTKCLWDHYALRKRHQDIMGNQESPAVREGNEMAETWMSNITQQVRVCFIRCGVWNSFANTITMYTQSLLALLYLSVEFIRILRASLENSSSRLVCGT